MLRGATSSFFCGAGGGDGERERDAQDAEEAESDVRPSLTELAVVDCDIGEASANFSDSFVPHTGDDDLLASTSVGASRRQGGNFASCLSDSFDADPRGTNSAAVTLQGRRNRKLSLAAGDFDSAAASDA
jgi:hypothetical protein